MHGVYFFKKRHLAYCVCVYMYAMAQARKSEDILQEPVLSFRYRDREIKLRFLVLAASPFSCKAILPAFRM